MAVLSVLLSPGRSRKLGPTLGSQRGRCHAVPRRRAEPRVESSRTVLRGLAARTTHGAASVESSLRPQRPGAIDTIGRRLDPRANLIARKPL